MCHRIHTLVLGVYSCWKTLAYSYKEASSFPSPLKMFLNKLNVKISGNRDLYLLQLSQCLVQGLTQMLDKY